MTTGPSEKKPGTCPTCGAENAPGSRFCERCGTRLPPSSREAAGPTPTTPADATLTFDRPLVGFPREESAPSASADRPVDAGAATAREAAPQAEVRDEPTGLRDAPTMNFDLPTLPTPEQREARSAETLSFDLPEWAQYEKAEDATAPSADRDVPAPPSSPPTPEVAPAEIDATGDRSWDYQPWTPQRPTEQPAPPPTTEQGGTRPAIVLPPGDAARGATRAPGDTGAPPPQATPQATGYPQQPPMTGQFGGEAQPAPPTQSAYTYPTPGPTPGPVAQPAAQLPPTAGAPPTYGYPQGGATAWNPPAATAYPAPATGNNNRTLWIILGVVGGLLVLCAMICVLIFLVGVASASSTGAVATGVATTTRP